MVMDFKDLKQAMGKVIGPWDHSLILSSDDPLVEILLSGAVGMVHMVLVPFMPTAENMAEYIAERLNAVLPASIHTTSVKVWETATSYAEWRSHE